VRKKNSAATLTVLKKKTAPRTSRFFAALCGASLLAGCAATPPRLDTLPSFDRYCLAAQRIVTRTRQPVRLVVHDEFDAFVKSKAVIEGPEIQQFNWYDDGGLAAGVSCKLKSADHLNLSFGPDTAGPDGACQDMNRAVYARIVADVDRPVFDTVLFDRLETVSNEDEPGMTGPDWLAPYTATWVDDGGRLHIRAKGFRVDFSDPRFARAPARFRGVHYCHFIAPAHLARLLRGTAKPGIVIGREVDTRGFSAPGQE